jgi:hypothetical protein
MAPNTTPTKKAKIIVWKREGRSHDWIREHLTGRNTISDRQINRIWNRYHEKENYYDVGQKSGRPHKMTERDTRSAARKLATRAVDNATHLQQQEFPDLSVKTVKRHLKGLGLESHIRRRVPLISRANLVKRRAWARDLRHWTADDWKRVIFSDESIFRLIGSDGVEWCWRKPNERLDPRFTKKTVKGGGGKVTVWGMITPHGLGRLVRIWGNMDKFLYREILEEDLLGSMDDLDLDIRDYYFQQDNDPKHTSGVATTWCEENNVDLLPWVASSPDMNIIEHVWDRLDRMVRARKPLPQNVEQLWVALQEEWVRMDEDFITHLYESMPRRVDALHEAKGGSTRY